MEKNLEKDPLKGFSLFNTDFSNYSEKDKSDKSDTNEEEFDNEPTLKFDSGETDEDDNKSEDNTEESDEKTDDKSDEKEVTKKSDTTKKTSTTKEEEPVEEETEVEEEIETEEQYLPIINHFGSKGILDIPEELEDSEEGLEKAVEFTVDNRVNKKIESRLSVLGEDGKKFLEYVEAGGNPKNFIEAYYNPVSWENFTANDNDDYKYAIKQSLVNLEDYTEEEADEMIKEWEDLEALEKYGKKHISKLQKLEATEKENMVKTQLEADKKALKDREEAYTKFKENLLKKEEISGFKISPKERAELVDYMTKVDKKTGKTAYQLDGASNEEASIMFAYLMKNKFNIDKLEKQVKTKVVSSLSDKLKNIKVTDSRAKLKSGQSDDFEDIKVSGKNSFSGFTKIKN